MTTIKGHGDVHRRRVRRAYERFGSTDNGPSRRNARMGARGTAEQETAWREGASWHCTRSRLETQLDFIDIPERLNIVPIRCRRAHSTCCLFVIRFHWTHDRKCRWQRCEISRFRDWSRIRRIGSGWNADECRSRDLGFGERMFSVAETDPNSRCWTVSRLTRANRPRDNRTCFALTDLRTTFIYWFN